MKTLILLFLGILTLGACSSPKETPARPAPPKISREDKLRGGYSFSNAIVIRVDNEATGLKEEYTWLSNNYPGYGLIKRIQTTRSSRHYDVVRIKTKQGRVKDIYFDSTSFHGRN